MREPTAVTSCNSQTFITVLTVYSVLPSIIGTVLSIGYYAFFDIGNVLALPPSNFRAAMGTTVAAAVLLFIVGMSFGIGRTARWSRLLLRLEHAPLTPDETRVLNRMVLTSPLFALRLTVYSWAAASILIPGIMFTFGARIEGVIDQFFDILFIGGTISAFITFLLFDSFTRRYIPVLIPDGDAVVGQGFRRVPLHFKLLASFVIGGVIPLLLFGYVSHLAHAACEMDPIIAFQYRVLVGFIAALALTILAMSTRYWWRHLSCPLEQFEAALKAIEGGDLDYRLVVDQNDEIGLIHAGFNRMVRGLKAAQADREKLLRVEQELAIARDVQNRVLTGDEALSRIGHLDIAVSYLPQNGRVGGDYYNIDLLDRDLVTVMIADATGHGIHAALSTLQIDLMNSQNKELVDPDRRLCTINKFYAKNSPPGSFFTAFIINVRPDAIQFASAGHPAQLLVRPATGELFPLHGRGRVIGFATEGRFEAGAAAIMKGDVILLFSDGLIEEFNDANEEYGEERLHAAVRELILAGACAGPMGALNERILAGLFAFMGDTPPNDDITLIAIRIK